MATTPGGGSASLLAIGEGLWVRANQAYAQIAGAQTAEALSARAGKCNATYLLCIVMNGSPSCRSSHTKSRELRLLGGAMSA